VALRIGNLETVFGEYNVFAVTGEGETRIERCLFGRDKLGMNEGRVRDGRRVFPVFLPVVMRAFLFVS
jgi:hypothetical protein